MVFTFFRFSYTLRDVSGRRKSSKIEDKIVSPSIIPQIHQLFGFKSQVVQILSLSKFYLKWIVKQGPFLFIALAGMILVFVISFISGTGGYDVELHMTSSRAVSIIVGAFSLFFVIIVMVVHFNGYPITKYHHCGTKLLEPMNIIRNISLKPLVSSRRVCFICIGG